MRSNLENVSTLERKLNIEVPAAEVQEAFDRALKDIQRNVTVKGFRKGKAPLNTIQSIYGDRLKQDVIQDLIRAKYAEALVEHSLDPISYPTIEFDPLEEKTDFQFTAEFEVRPEVTLKELEGLPVKKETMPSAEKVIEDTLQDIRKSRAETVPVLEDRPAQNGDVAVIDFIGYMDGQELEGGKGEGHELELGSNSFIPGFEEGVVGMRQGVTTTLTIKFPDEYHAAQLAGKPVEFKVTLKELKKKDLPELNDEMAKGLGPYENLEALKTAIREDYERRETRRIHDEMKNRIMRELVDRNPVAVPKALMVDQKKALVEDLKKRMEGQGLPDTQFEEYKDKWDADFEQTASYMIQSSFLIDKIATDHGLRATDKEVEVKIRDYAQNSGIDFERVQEFYKEDDRRARLAYQVTEEKVLDFLISKAKVTEVSKDELAKENA
jgi:trigger factor